MGGSQNNGEPFAQELADALQELKNVLVKNPVNQIYLYGGVERLYNAGIEN
jgi:hypothetical protein